MDSNGFSSHFSAQRWLGLTEDIRQAMQARGCHPSRCVVLVPYAQLMGTARQAWVELARQRGDASLYLPRVETTQNWAQALWAAKGGYQARPDDLRLDMAFDLLNAGQWLARMGLQQHREVLAPRLVEAAWSLARRAQAVLPAERGAWAARLQPQLTAAWSAPVLALEAAVAQLALAWAGTSAYATDLLFEQTPDLLVTLEGFQRDPLTDALCQARGDRVLVLPLAEPARARGRIVCQSAADAHEEAERAAACVIDLLARQVQPVGLIAQDRVLTRRVRALLAQHHIAVRDETGWTLSTTRAAAALMVLLRALSREASCDTVLDWLKQVPSLQADLPVAEAELRRAGIRRWGSIRAAQPHAHALAEKVEPWRQALQQMRPLHLWLSDLREVLQQSGQWDAFERDVAGQAVLDALRLHEGAEQEFTALDLRLSRQEVTRWISHALESGSFAPVHPPQAQVVILPLSQLLGRSLAAVVLPGADEINLPTSPEPPGPWTVAQRALLGLPSRQTLQQWAGAAWEHALGLPEVHVLWRQSENSETVMPSPWVQTLRLAGVSQPGEDLRPRRQVSVQAVPMSAVSGASLPVTEISATAYADLRSCPYRFFALRQLRLQEAQELEAELDKRDFGNWLHLALDQFHRTLQTQPTRDAGQRLSLLDDAAHQARLKLDLEPAEFLPFQAAWPQVRDGYLAWLDAHEADGMVFVSSEARRQRLLDELTLAGTIDRIDRGPDGALWLLDYKTESDEKTRQRITQGAEDTQLAFYAALMGDEPVVAAYVNLGEKGQTRTHAQAQIHELRERLVAGLRQDLDRLHAGEPLRALGDGQVCVHCQARGLCRKDFIAHQTP